ncbi:hypothetical protein [Rhodopirellula sp. P2]|uniref:hypothetical protein n=1 Tax=Rhodopirellula sp. P2 TaxID=2127060 RepID=UPI0023675EFE|nr:hypothetical protein [Rhodopirellula sp. P2]WDQ15123.1 hypothetical protein PSR62_15915 [Rhodopirellula sp. P2]
MFLQIDNQTAVPADGGRYPIEIIPVRNLNRSTKLRLSLYVLTGAVALLSLGVFAYRLLMATALALVLEDIADDEDFSLFGSSHSSVQTVGEFNDETAESNYRFVTGGLGFGFTDGTEIDQHDNAWDILVCCFTIPQGGPFPDFSDQRFVEGARPDSASSEFAILTPENQAVPVTARRFDLILPDDHYRKYLYSDAKSNRVWVRYGYQPPTD